jgi:hypothetical protein
MSEEKSQDDQRRDRLLLRLLKAPPQPRPKRERGPAREQKEGQEEKRGQGGAKGNPIP